MTVISRLTCGSDGSRWIRRRLDAVDRQRRQNRGRAAERIAIDGEHRATVGDDMRRQRTRRGIVDVGSLRGAQADGTWR